MSYHTESTTRQHGRGDARDARGPLQPPLAVPEHRLGGGRKPVESHPPGYDRGGDRTAVTGSRRADESHKVNVAAAAQRLSPPDHTALTCTGPAPESLALARAKVILNLRRGGTRPAQPTDRAPTTWRTSASTAPVPLTASQETVAAHAESRYPPHSKDGSGGLIAGLSHPSVVCPTAFPRAESCPLGSRSKQGPLTGRCARSHPTRSPACTQPGDQLHIVR